MKIERISGLKGRMEAFKSCLADNGSVVELRDSGRIFDTFIGKPDSFAVFAYLYRRFGVPTIDTAADPKILFEYLFRVDGVLVSIHGSTGTSVYFKAYIPGRSVDTYLQRFDEFQDSLAARLHAKEIPYVNGNAFPELCVNKHRAEKNVKLWMDAARRLLSQDEYDVILETQRKSDNGDKISDEDYSRLQTITMGVSDHIYMKLVKPEIADAERDLFYPLFGEKAFPDIASVARDFCKELLVPYPVRDRHITINGIL